MAKTKFDWKGIAQRGKERRDKGEYLFPVGVDVKVKIVKDPYNGQPEDYWLEKGKELYQYIFEIDGVQESHLFDKEAHLLMAQKFKYGSTLVVRCVSPNEWEFKDVSDVATPDVPERVEEPVRNTEAEMWLEKEKRELRHRCIATAGNILKDTAGLTAQMILMDAELYFDAVMNGFAKEAGEAQKTQDEEYKDAKRAIIDEIVNTMGSVNDLELERLQLEMNEAIRDAFCDGKIQFTDNTPAAIRKSLESVDYDSIEAVFGIFTK